MSFKWTSTQPWTIKGQILCKIRSSETRLTSSVNCCFWFRGSLLKSKWKNCFMVYSWRWCWLNGPNCFLTAKRSLSGWGHATLPTQRKGSVARLSPERLQSSQFGAKGMWTRGISGQGPISRKSRNFSGHFRVSQFLLYLKNGEHF